MTTLGLLEEFIMASLRYVGPRYNCADGRGLRRLVLVLLVLIAMLGQTRAARAQGVGEALPKPMATAELVRYMEQLDLSPQQQLAVTTMHDDYKRAYAGLYESAIEPFLAETRGMGGMSMPQREEMEKIVRGLRTLEGRIRTLDNSLFDQMQAMLTEDQLANMPRVRLARLRACYNQQQLLQMWTMGSPIIDVSATVYDLKLSAQHMELIDPTLARYESNITGRIGRLHDGATTLWMDIFNAIEAAGFDMEQLENMEEADPEEMQRFFSFIQQTFMELTAKGRTECARIQDTNRTTVQSMRGVVPDDVYRTIRNAYYARAYPNVSVIAMNMPVGTAGLADVKTLAADKRAEAADAVNRALVELDRLIEATADKADAFRQSFNFMDFDAEKFQKHNEAMNEMQREATAIVEGLNKQLHAIFTAEQLAEWQQRIAADAKRISPSMMAMAAPEAPVAEENAGAGEGEPAEAVENENQFTNGSFLPPRIAQRDLTIYLALMNLGDDQQAIVKELYKTYCAAFDELEQGPVKEVNDLRMEMWRYDENGERATTPADIEQVYAKRQIAMDAVAEADRAFFEDVQLLLADKDAVQRLQRVRELRERQNYNRASAMGNYGWGAGDAESRIDVVEFLAKQNIPGDSLQSVDPLMKEYEQASMPLLKQRSAVVIDMQRLQEVWGLRWQEIQSDEGAAAANATLMAEYQNSVGDAQKKVNAIDQEIAALNSKYMQRILAQLPSAKAYDARTSYNRLAFPSIYSDASAVRKYIDKSIDLNDLSNEQRGTLIDLRAEYQPSYDTLCERMLALTRESPVRKMTMDSDDWAGYSEFHDKMQRLQFDRDELNSRALLRLRAVLSEAQIESIGGLPEIEKRDGNQHVAW